MIELALRRNVDYHTGALETEPRYFFEVTWPGLTQPAPRIPVFWRLNAFAHILTKELYVCVVGGQTVEKGNVLALEREVKWVLEGLLRDGQLPRFILASTHRKTFAPIYVRRQAYLVPVAGGRLARFTQLASIFEHLVQLGRQEADWELGLLSWQDLRLSPSAGAFVVLTKPPVRIPVFYDASIQALVLGSLEVQAQTQPVTGSTLLAWHNEIAGRLIEQKLLGGRFDLFVERLIPPLWEVLKEGFRPTEWVFSVWIEDSFGLREREFPVWLLQKTPCFIQEFEGWRSLVFGADVEDLRFRLTQRLMAEGRIPSPSVALKKRSVESAVV